VNFVVSSGYDNYHAWSQHICQSAHYILHIILYKSLPVGHRFEHVYLSKYLSLPVRLRSLHNHTTACSSCYYQRTCPPPPHFVWLTFFAFPSRTLHTHTHTYMYIYNNIIYYSSKWTTTRQVVWIEFLNNFVPLDARERPNIYARAYTLYTFVYIYIYGYIEQ